MKLPTILAITASVLVLGGITALLVLKGVSNEDPVTFDVSRIESLPQARQEESLKSLMLGSSLPDREKIELIKWLFSNKPEYASQLCKDNALVMPDLARLLSRATYELLQAKSYEPAMRALGEAKVQFPNDPYVLGVSGVAALLAGKETEALNFLNQAESWRRNIPIVDFYLGGLLTRSDSAADRARGKALLLKVVRDKDPDLGELAAFALITNRDIPIIAEEYRAIFDFLLQSGAFREDNDNLNGAILQVLLNRTIQYYPGQAVTLAKLFLSFPEAGLEDRLTAVQLAQSLGKFEEADALYAEFVDPDDFPEGSGEHAHFLEVQAVQDMLKGRYEQGLREFGHLVDNMPEAVRLPEMFRIVLSSELPMDIERSFLALYLQLPSKANKLSLAVLQKLLEIDPLREEEWILYARENLLELDPGMVGSWLNEQGHPEAVIAGLAGRSGTLNEEGATVLIEAAIGEEEVEQARKFLKDASGVVGAGAACLMTARIHLLEGNKEAAYEKWQEAYNTALVSDSFPLLKTLGILALELEQPVTALRALYTAFSAGIPFTEGQARTLQGLTLNFGTLAQSVKVAEYINETFPGNPVHQNNLAYFKFLAETDMDFYLGIMRELVEEYPDMPNYRLTLALGLVKIGRNNEASRLLQNTSINWAEASNRAQLIYAVVLGVNNQRVVAEGLIQNIDLDALIPEEKALLESF